MVKLFKKATFILLFCLYGCSSTLWAELSINNMMNGQFFYNTKQTNPYMNGNLISGELVDNYSMQERLDNRFMFQYENDWFQVEAHLLTSISHNDTSNFNMPSNSLYIKDDAYSLFNLTSVSSSKYGSFTNRIDRLNISFTSPKYQLTIGRTALTWSRARIFHVTDFFNPQIPGFYDGTYKIGVDVLYNNFSLGQDDSIAFVINPRRSFTSQEITYQDATVMGKYLHSNSTSDYTVMVGRYLRDYIFAVGFSSDFILGSVLRSDVSIVSTEAEHDKAYVVGVVGLEESFYWLERAHTIFTEYYYNGLGIKNIGSSLNPMMNPSMVKRFSNGDTVLLATNYVALGLSSEITSYINFTASGVMNTLDKSIFHNLGISYNYNEHLDLSLSASIPVGDNNSEFGEICNLDICKVLPQQYILGFTYNI